MYFNKIWHQLQNIKIFYEQKYWPYPYVDNFYWSFDYGPSHIVVVDQYAPYTSNSPQYKWLENDLSGTDKQWIFIVFHEPSWSAGNHENNNEVQTYIQPLCEQYGVDIVFAGHNHYYARAEVNRVQHVTTGGEEHRFTSLTPVFRISSVLRKHSTFAWWTFRVINYSAQIKYPAFAQINYPTLKNLFLAESFPSLY